MPTQVITETQRRDAQRVIQRGEELQFQITHAGETLELGPETCHLLSTVLKAAATGSALRLERLPEELTTVQAAKLLSVSRPTIIKWVNESRLACRMAGAHRRIPLDSVLQLKRNDRAARASAFDEMRDLEDSLDLKD